MANKSSNTEAAAESLQTRVNTVCTEIQTQVEGILNLAQAGLENEKSESYKLFVKEMLVSELFRSIGHWVNNYKNQLNVINNETEIQ